jgi:hypothetical protein
MYPTDDTEARLRLATRDLAEARQRLEREIAWSRTLRAMAERARNDWMERFAERRR